MDVETTGRTIQLILAPVVMVTACGLLISAMVSHYSAINQRLRALAAERRSLSLVAPDDEHLALATERLTEIDHQLPLLVRRHRMVHHAVLLAYTAVVVLVISMFVIAVAALTDSSAIGTGALFVFLGGAASLMAGAVLMVAEIRTSDDAVAYEAGRAAELPAAWRGPD